jgi:hypothetical protein
MATLTRVRERCFENQAAQVRAASFPGKRRCFRIDPSRLARMHGIFEELAREHLMELAGEEDDAAEPEHL